LHFRKKASQDILSWLPQWQMKAILVSLLRYEVASRVMLQILKHSLMYSIVMVFFFPLGMVNPPFHRWGTTFP
jgi:hypothetical protein